MRGPRRTAIAATTVALLAASALPTAAADADPPTVTRQVVPGHDGTPIVTNLFLPPGASPEAPVPLVLETHGWGGTGRTSPGGLTGRLVEAGYAVLTWDSRGFGCSGGEVRIDDPQVEGRDVSALVDWAVEQGFVRTEPTAYAEQDPVVGMVGGSYAGGIQTAAASIDPRIDAIAPEMSWSDLRYSLAPGDVVKQGWVALLYAAGTATSETLGLDPNCDAGPQVGGLDPAIHAAVVDFAATGRISPATRTFLAGSSLAAYGDEHPVTIPTLVANSSVDTLFDVTDGLGIHEHVLAAGAPSRYLVYCGGHVSCPTTYAPADDAAHLRDAVVAWFDEHLRGVAPDVPAPRFEYRTNEGVWRSLDRFPTVDDGAVEVTGEADGLVVVPVLDVPDVAGLARESGASGGTLPANPLTAAAVSRAEDPRAATFEVARAEGGPLELVGIPEVELTVGGALLDGLEALPSEVADELLAQLRLDALEPLADAAGDLLGAVPVAGGLLGGLLDGVSHVSGADAVPRDVHLFVKLVHREAGEVVDLQEGTARVPLTGGPATVAVAMPGLAYTVPEGDHLDLQVSTASLAHATGRVPAVVDVAVAAAVPVQGLPADAPADPPDTDRDGTPDSAPDEPGTERGHTDGRGRPPADPPAAGPRGARVDGAALPATGGGLGLAGLTALVGGALLRRQRAS